MRNKEIKEKFEKLEERIESLETVQKDHYDTIQFLLSIMKRYIDEPVFRTKLSDNWYKGFLVKENLLQYAYKNKINEIATTKPILHAELFAYCDTHFILKSIGNEYFLVSMEEKTITDIPIQLFLSKEMKNLTVEGQTLKICHSGPGIVRVRND